MIEPTPTVLIIAGSDPGSGAGIQADLKTCSAWGVYATCAITALTVQNTRQVYRTHPVHASLVYEQCEKVATDFALQAVKIGMLLTRENVRAVARFLSQFSIPYVVLDPVLKATNGEELLEKSALHILKEELLPRVHYLTPNLNEARILTGMTITTEKDMIEASHHFLRMGVRGVVLKGGHLKESRNAIDIVATQDEVCLLVGPRYEFDAHGTGCTFASALTAGLVRGFDFLKSAFHAKVYTSFALKHAKSPGKGISILNHFWTGSIPYRSPESASATIKLKRVHL